jgi:cell division septal protein FtsQ
VSAPKRLLLATGTVAFMALAWLGWSWFRESSLVKVRHVEITGVSNSPDAQAIKHRLREATLRMTTLDVDAAKLEQAVAGYPIVRAVSASGDFPSTAQVKVREYAPVAALIGPDGRAIPVAYDGTLLPRLAPRKLPAVTMSSTPARVAFESARVRTLVRVLAAAPSRLRPQLARAYLAPEGKGVLVAMRNGPTLELGTSARLAAKWASATRVLGAPSSLGADEIDVRLPERPAARGFASADNPQF